MSARATTAELVHAQQRRAELVSMRGRRAASVHARHIGAVVLLLGVVFHHRASAAECRATALLEGDAALVDSVDAALRGRGIATTATASCPAATAQLERRGTAVTVIVTDPHGRRSERTLVDVDAAASLIESWARQDLNAASLLGWTEPVPVAPERVRIEPPRGTRIDALPATRARTRDPVTLVAAGESSVGFDGTSWLGARVGGCVRLGPVCAGANARLLVDDPRRSYDVLAAVELPIAVGARIVLVTGAGIGPGWFQSQSARSEVVTKVTHAGLRLDAHASLSLSLSRYVSLHAGISLGASPLAPVLLEMGGDMPLTNGEPTGFVRGDIGLRIGAP